MAEEPQPVQLPVSWATMSELPTNAANAFLIQVNPTSAGRPAELVLNVGFLAPPPFAGTPAEQIAQVRNLERVDVRPVVRLSFGRERAEELRQALDQVLTAWDQASRQP